MSENKKMAGVAIQLKKLPDDVKILKQFQEKYGFQEPLDYSEKDNDIFYDLDEKDIGRWSLFSHHEDGLLLVHLWLYDYPSYDENNLSVGHSTISRATIELEELFGEEIVDFVDVLDDDCIRIFCITYYTGGDMPSIWKGN